MLKLSGPYPSHEWQSSGALLVQGPLLYAFLYLGGGWLFFYKLFIPAKFPFVLRLKKGKNSIALLWGFLGGSLAFFTLFLLMEYREIFFGWNQNPEQWESPPLREMLQKDWSLFLWHLLCSALLTAVSEEGYYRGCLQNYLQQKFSPLFSICISAFIFALVHGDRLYFMLLPAFVFSILFWKQGLVSAIVAHAVYNTLILTATVLGY